MQAETLQKLSSMDARTVKLLSNKRSMLIYNLTCSNVSVETAFEFSKFKLLMLQIQQMTIFSSSQPRKWFETHLEQLFLSFAFLMKVLSSLGGLFSNG